MKKIKVYGWDSVMMEVEEYDVEAPPSGLSDHETMVLMNDRVSQLVDDPDEQPLRQMKTESMDGVLVLSGKFGRGQTGRLFFCPGDPKKAKKTAEDMEDED